MVHKIAIITAFLVISLSNSVYSQYFGNFSLAGGPSAGWSFNKVDDLNKELRNAGFPELSTSGFLTLGGGGFMDFPIGSKGFTFLRIGAMGTGFESKEKKQFNDTLNKAVTYNFGMGGISVDYVKQFGPVDISGGVLLTTGTLKIDLYQYGNDYGNYNSIFGELSGNSSTTNITRNYVNRFFAVQPQVGVGVFAAKFLYLRLMGGYTVASTGTWRVDNDVEVKNFPTGIKPGGFNLNFSANFGLFLRD